MRKTNIPEPRVIDYHEDGDIFEFTVRLGDHSITDRKYRGSKKTLEAYFEAQRLMKRINNP